MSYFDSILASVGLDSDGQSNPAPTASVAKTSSQPSNIPPKAIMSTGSIAKRKADAELTTPVTKTLKTGNQSDLNVTKSMAKSPALKPNKAFTLPAQAKPRSELPPDPRKIPAKATAPSRSTSDSKPTTPASVPVKQPAPNSLAGLLARAKTMQTTQLSQKGGYINKSTIKSKEEAKENRKKVLEARRFKGPITKAKVASRSGSEGPSAQKKVIGRKKAPVEDKPKRKPVEVAYKGTMRGSSTQATYKGTVNIKSTPDARREDPSRHNNHQHRRDYSDSAEDDEEEDYDSAASSDMEAGAWDIDEEEELAAREARKEDAREQRLEEELKRKKNLRKQGLVR